MLLAFIMMNLNLGHLLTIGLRRNNLQLIRYQFLVLAFIFYQSLKRFFFKFLQVAVGLKRFLRQRLPEKVSDKNF